MPPLDDSLSNPYAAPQAELQTSDLPQALELYLNASSTRGSDLTFAWILLFCLNLPLASVLGFMVCHGLGTLGLLAAVVGLLALTTFLFRHTGRFANYWIAGAIVVALSQFLPYLHIHLGAFAVSLFDAPRDQLNFVQAMLCTIIVGGGLLGVSLVLAAFFYLLFALRDER